MSLKLSSKFFWAIRRCRLSFNLSSYSQGDKTPDGTPVKALDFRVLRPAEVTAIQAIITKLLQANPNDEAIVLIVGWVRPLLDTI